MVQFVLIALLVLLTACSSNAGLPSNKLVEGAIALGLEQTQQQLSKQLGLETKGFKVNRVEIEQREPLDIENLPAYHVKGTYALTVRLQKRKLTTQHNSFDVYLQRQKEGKTWRVLLPLSDQDSKIVWRSYLID